MKRKTKLLSIILTVVLCISMFCGSAFAAESKSTQRPVPGTTTSEVLQDAAGTTTSSSKKMSVLFIGTSILYYNNLPQMFERITEAADTGMNANVYTLLYASRDLTTHASAIKAVYDVNGNAKDLTKKQKALFRFTRTKGDPGKYSEDVFKEYKKVLYDNKGKKRTFDYIVLQHNAGSCEYTTIKKEVTSLINVIGTKNTTFILHMPNDRFRASKSIASQKVNFMNTVVKTDEKVVNNINKYASRGTSFKEVKLSYAGLAFYNYLSKYGVDYAQKKVPNEYTRYKGDIETDINLKKSAHPTQLGTYLAAATVYSTITGKSAAAGASSYKATVSCDALNIRGLYGGKNYAGRDAFNSTAILKNVCNIANKTENGGLR